MTGAVDTARQYQDLFDLYWPIAVGVLVVVWLALLVLVIRYRERRPGDEWPEQVHERKRTEMAYTALLAVVAAVRAR